MGSKIGKPIPNISKEQAIARHDECCNCSGTHIISKPYSKIEFFNMFCMRYYTVHSWHCLNCNWESEKIKTRVV
jgi:hypothetical protein